MRRVAEVSVQEYYHVSVGGCETGVEGRAFAVVADASHYARAAFERNVPGAVFRAVVYDDDFSVYFKLVEGIESRADTVRFVVGGNNY